MNKYQRRLFLSCFILLAGCHSRIDEVKVQMEKVRTDAALAIEPGPTLEAAPIFEYAAYQRRSPFLPNSLADELKQRANKRIDPDLSRPRQALEHYSLELLRMKGSLTTIYNQPFAFIQTPDRDIKRIGLGDYMGLNHGRVVRITPTRIDLVEIVSDGSDGYFERSRSLVLLDHVSE